MGSIVKLGPWGGDGGIVTWSFQQTATSGIKSIELQTGSVVDSITFTIADGNGKTTTLKYGGPGGPNNHKVEIDWPNEYLVTISGTRGDWHGRHVTSLSFYTNKQQYGPFGVWTEGQQGVNNVSSFSVPLVGGSTVGFHGQAGAYIDAIGFLAKPNN